MKSPTVFGPLTKLQCCPTSDGSGAAILANEEFVIRHGLQAQAVLIVGMEMSTDLPSTFTSKSHMNLVSSRYLVNIPANHAKRKSFIQF